jgi:hypothetical protein
MEPHSRPKRKFGWKKRDEPGNSARDEVTTVGTDPRAEPESSARDRDDRQRKAQKSGVTHRSPSPDDLLLPCCGRPVSEVAARDRVTTDPAEVTCGG